MYKEIRIDQIKSNPHNRIITLSFFFWLLEKKLLKNKIDEVKNFLMEINGLR